MARGNGTRSKGNCSRGSDSGSFGTRNGTPSAGTPSSHHGSSSYLPFGEANIQVDIQPDTQAATPSAEETSSGSAPNRRGRGPNVGEDPPDDVDDRKLIQILSNSTFYPTTVVRSISRTIKMHYPEPHPTWKDLPKEYKDLCYNQFMATYRFATVEEEGRSRSVWGKIGSERIRDSMYKARSAALEKSGGDFEIAKQHRPTWIGEDDWSKLCDKFKDEKFQNLSASGSSNRQKGDGLNHVSGSIPFVVHGKRMVEELGREPTQIEIFRRTHQKSEVYINEKSKKVGETYESTLKDKYGEDSSSQPFFDADAWIEALGGLPKKGKVYGFGSRKDLDAILRNYSRDSSSTSRSQPSNTPVGMESMVVAALKNPTIISSLVGNTEFTQALMLNPDFQVM